MITRKPQTTILLLSEHDWVAAVGCARGCYQGDLILGTVSWDGDDLRGNAKKHAARYAASRQLLLTRLCTRGIGSVQMPAPQAGYTITILGLDARAWDWWQSEAGRAQVARVSDILMTESRMPAHVRLIAAAVLEAITARDMRGWKIRTPAPDLLTCT